MCLSKYRNIWRILIVPFIIGLAPVSGYSQWVDPSNGAVVEPTATMSQFMRYGNTPVSLYTGSVDVSVPIYTYEDYEFNIPVVLRYAFRGQKPNEPAGSFGLGWVLNAGGCITRQVNHYPDDFEGTGHIDGAYGFYYLHKSNLEIPSIYSSAYPSGNNLGNDLYSYFYPVGGRKYEAEPDIFSFNFLGHSGKFLFWEKNQIVVYETSDPIGNYSVEPVLTVGKFTGFIIKTKDGYTYTFGCNSDLYLNDDMYSSDHNYNSVIKNSNAPHVMWPLVSAKAPSGREIRFEYEKGSECVVTERPMSFIVETNNQTGTMQWKLEWNHLACMSQQEQKNLYLKRITMSNTFSIDFTYSGQRKVEKGYNMHRGLLGITTEGLLQSVVIKDLSNNSTVKTASCSYSEGRPNRVPILKNVYVSDVGYYGFTYWYEDDSSMAKYWTPYKGTCNIDHWGYSNGRDNDNRSISYFIPSSTLDNNKETITSSQRNPDFKYAICGALRTISYPTQGKTDFIYEPNDYSVAIIKSGLSSGSPGPEYYDNNKIAGGIRIKQIVDYNVKYGGYRIDTMRVRTYDYHVNGKSTGVLLRSPRYKTSHVTTGSSQSSIHKRYVASSDILDCIDTDHHIEYSAVTETNRDGSYCRYTYSTYAIPSGGGGFDRGDDMSLLYKNVPETEVYGDPCKYLYMRPGSYKMMRGRLCSKTLYHAKQNPKDEDKPSYQESYQYTGPGNRLWTIRMTRYYWYQQPIYAGNCYMNYSMKINYLGGRKLAMHTYYSYDFKTGYLKRVETLDTTGKKIRQDIDYGGANRGPFPAKTHYQVCLPGETEYKTTEINKYEYEFYRVTPSFTIPRMTKHWKTHLKSPKVYASDAEYENDLVLEHSFLPSASRFNQITDRAGNVTTYLYDNGGCNLLAVVKNVSYSDVQAALQNQSSLGRYSLSSSQEAALRNMPQAVVTTYSYTPLTGLASVTDPSGSTQSYAYDSHRRLAKIYSDGVLEKEFKYQLYNLR